MNTQDWFPLGWTGWMSLQSKRLSRVFSKTTVQKHQFFGTQIPTLTSIHDYWKNIAWSRWTFIGKINVCFLICCLGGHNFSSKGQPSFSFMAAVTICRDFWAHKIMSVTVSTVSPSICLEVIRPDDMILVFWMLSFKPNISDLNWRK